MLDIGQTIWRLQSGAHDVETRQQIADRVAIWRAEGYVGIGFHGVPEITRQTTWDEIKEMGRKTYNGKHPNAATFLRAFVHKTERGDLMVVADDAWVYVAVVREADAFWVETPANGDPYQRRRWVRWFKPVPNTGNLRDKTYEGSGTIQPIRAEDRRKAVFDAVADQEAPTWPASRTGRPYTPWDGNVPTEIRPSNPDATLTSAGWRDHFDLQNALAAHAERQGLEPLKPTKDKDDPDYDVAWENAPDVLTVIEVKSFTKENEKDQLHYGLGQVLDYAYRLRCCYSTVHPVLWVQREPVDDRHWTLLCADFEVTLAWPGEERRVFG